MLSGAVLRVVLMETILRLVSDHPQTDGTMSLPGMPGPGGMFGKHGGWLHL